MRKIVFVMIFVVACVPLAGQQPGEEYGYAVSFEDDFRDPISDTTLLFAPLGSGISIYDDLSRYNLNFAAYRRRGYPERFSSYRLGGLDISADEKYPDYGFYSVLREGAVLNSESGGLVAALGRHTAFGIDASDAVAGHTLGLNYSDRRYRAGIRLSSAGPVGNGWHYYAKFQRRWGRDAFISGVFTDAALFSAAAEKRFKDGTGLSLFVVAAPSQRGGRTWATEEAYELTGDNYYNPSWGTYGGRERNLKVYYDFTPAVVAAYTFRPSGGSRYRLTAGWRFGERRRGGLTWYDARNPSPDYYMNMPGWFPDSGTAAEVERAWRDGETGQLDWMEMYEANLMSGGPATYVSDERVERLSRLQAALYATTTINPRTKAEWGVRVKYRSSNYFKRAKDLLGAEYLLDVDQYLIDDQYYGDKYHNDMRNPDRIVRRGDRFGYDYDIVKPEAELYGALYRAEGRWSLSVGGELGFGTLYRTGNYEKETFPGRDSYGSSERLGFTTYSLSGSARYSLSASHHAELRLTAGEYEPEWNNVFLAPESHNHTAEFRNASVAGAEIRYACTLWGTVGVEFAAYYTQASGETEIVRYYDDLYAEYAADNYSGYSIMTMTGIGRRSRGLEAGISADITPRLRLRVAGSLNSYTYSSDPDVSVVADVNLQPRLTDAKSYMTGYISSASPQDAAAASLRYSTFSRWRFELTWAYAGRRYVSASPVRRTSRIVALASSPEARNEFRMQERLPDASVLNLYVSKSFNLHGNNLFLSLSVNNLLNRTDIIYGGYEQARIFKQGTGVNRTFSPFPSRYSYYYPRTLYASMSYNF